MSHQFKDVGIVIEKGETEEERCTFCLRELGVCCPGFTQFASFSDEPGPLIPCPRFRDLAKEFPDIFVIGDLRREEMKDVVKRASRNKYIVTFRRMSWWSHRFLRHLNECKSCRSGVMNLCDEGARYMERLLSVRRKWHEMVSALKSRNLN